MLLMGAGVMVRSLLALRSVDAGYDPHNVLTMHVRLPKTRYTTPAQMSTFFETALQRLRALPGVEFAGAIDDLPSQGGSVQPLVIEGKTELLPRDQPTVEVRKITPGYLRAMRIPLLRGRDVADNDVEVDAGQPHRPQSCCGATSIRSDGARRCRCSRKPSSRKWSASSAT